MVGPCTDEDGASLRELDRLALDVEDAAPLQHDVDLVPLVRLLAVRLRGHEHVDADLDAGGLVDDLVASVPRGEALSHMADVEGVRDRSLHEA